MLDNTKGVLDVAGYIPPRRGKASGGAQWGGGGEGASLPVNAGVVPCQPREAQHQLEVRQPGDLKGETLCVGGMNTQARGKIVGDRTGAGAATIDELQGDGVKVGNGVQVMLKEDRWVLEGVGGTRVDQRWERNGR